MRNFNKNREQGGDGAGSDPDCGQLIRGLTPFAGCRRFLFWSIVFLWFAAPCSASYLKSMFPVNVKLESVSVLLANGKKVSMDVPAIEEGGFVFVPVRFAAQASRARILWNVKEKRAVFIVQEKTITMTCCRSFYEINGKRNDLPVDIFLMEGRLMVPYKEVMSVLTKPVDSPAVSPMKSILEPPAVHAETPQDATLVKTKKPLYSEEPGWSSWGFGNFTRKIKKLFYDDLFVNSQNKIMGRLFVLCYVTALYLFFTRKRVPRSVNEKERASDGVISQEDISGSSAKEGLHE